MPAYIPHACSIGSPGNAPGLYKIWEGLPYAEEAPDDLSATMKEDPDRTLRFDTLGNTQRLLVVSKCVRDFLKDAKVTAIEYIPIQIRDHNGTPISERYWIINVLDPIDCLNKEESVYSEHPMDDSLFVNIKKIVLNDSPNRKIFRIEGIDEIIFSNDLISEMSHFTNMDWCPLEEYTT